MLKIESICSNKSYNWKMKLRGWLLWRLTLTKALHLPRTESKLQKSPKCCQSPYNPSAFFLSGSKQNYYSVLIRFLKYHQNNRPLSQADRFIYKCFKRIKISQLPNVEESTQKLLKFSETFFSKFCFYTQIINS